MAAPAFREHLAKAIRILGSQQKLAVAMGTIQSRINWLMQHAEQISAEDAMAVHAATKGRVPASDLRPDLWANPRHVPIPRESRRVA